MKVNLIACKLLLFDNLNSYRFLFNGSIHIYEPNTQSSHISKTQIDRKVRHTPFFIPIDPHWMCKQ